MARESRSPPFTGSAFIRSLAALNDVRATAHQDDFAQRVTQWFGWTHTFTLSAVLSDAPGPSDGGAHAPVNASADERECARVRAALLKFITAPPTDMAAEFTGCRRRYIACQQAMESQIGPLRRRLRATLAASAVPKLVKLAKLDGVMEEVIGVQERALLATVPGLLQPRFEQLRQANEPDGPWFNTFLQDMRALLLAELDLRLQPAEGLLAAQRTPSSDRHE
ncbi:DUF3348 family protein [Aquabacterium sp.]|uniref:DUF3348 family protein n=1 Tax=Aquabacterium sp. TaxID=1872578 RepID=UPI003D6C9246